MQNTTYIQIEFDITEKFFDLFDPRIETTSSVIFNSDFVEDFVDLHPE